MSKSWNRTETWVALFVVAIAGLLMAIFALRIYMTATATPLHPDAQNVPSETASDPAPKFAAAADAARQMIRAGLSEQNLPGLSVAVAVGGDVVWAEGFGFANLEQRTPVTPDTRFRIGTASPVLTSAAVGLLLEKGGLKLDEEIQAYVPQFPKKPWPVTLRQLLGHTAGVRTDSGDEGPLYGEQCERPVDALREFAGSTLLFEPGTDFRYSSYGWILISAAIEAATGQPFVAFMREHIFEPLAMRDTRDDSLTKEIPDRATFYFPKFAADPRYGPDLMRDVDYSCYAGASVFLSTPTDLVRFALAINGGKLLQPATVESLQTTQRLASGKETGYGLGWDLETVTMAAKQTRVIGHDGETLGGMVASLSTFPDHAIVVSVLSNVSYADTAGLAVKIAEAFAGQAGRAASH